MDTQTITPDFVARVKAEAEKAGHFVCGTSNKGTRLFAIAISFFEHASTDFFDTPELAWQSFAELHGHEFVTPTDKA